jgi:hypothetical protein
MGLVSEILGLPCIMFLMRSWMAPLNLAGVLMDSMEQAKLEVLVGTP